jgi:hypothetical protein
MILKGSAMPKDWDTDPWVAAFICELHSLFGTPVASSACKNKEDKLLYIWSMMGIANALSKHENAWRPMRKKVEPALAAESFARRYYTVTNKMVVEPAPLFSDKVEKPKALVAPKT